MLLIAFLLGCLATFGFFFVEARYRRHRFLTNPNADWSKSGSIPMGNSKRLGDCLQRVFASGPARSYVKISGSYRRLNDEPMTSFFIRSAGKRDGVHSYRGELRLSVEERHHATNAIPMLEQIGEGTIKRTDKSHGQLILESSRCDELKPLLAVADEFRLHVLGAPEEGPFCVSWHIPNSI